MPIVQTIEHALRSHGTTRSLRGLRIECVDDTITLTGEVRTFYAKQMAQEVVKKCLINGLRVENRIVVTQS
jgi:hypothetical protein